MGWRDTEESLPKGCGQLTGMENRSIWPHRGRCTTWRVRVSGWPIQGALWWSSGVGPEWAASHHCAPRLRGHVPQPGVAAVAEGGEGTLGGEYMCPPRQVPVGARTSSALGQEFTQHSCRSFLKTSSEKGREDHGAGLVPRGSMDMCSRAAWGSSLIPGNRHLGWGWGIRVRPAH